MYSLASSYTESDEMLVESNLDRSDGQFKYDRRISSGSLCERDA